MIKKNRILYFILLALCIPKIIFAAGSQFQPYMGYGAGHLTYGDKSVYDATVKGFLLGLKYNFAVTERFGIFVDYSRSGPINYVSEDTSSGFYTTKSVFNIFSGGTGLQWGGDSWLWSLGYYPYDRFIEYTRDFRFKGSMQRLTLGVPLNNVFKINFYYNLHSLVGDQLTDADRLLLCNFNTTNCEDKGEYAELGFFVSSGL